MLSTAALLLAVAPMKGGTITQAPFGKTAEGQRVTAYTLTNARGASAKVLDFGGVLAELKMPDKNGHMGDVVLGFDSLANYAKPGPYIGASVGRYANRIARGHFKLDGKTYTLAINNPPNTLHGGKKGYSFRMWKALPLLTPAGPSVTLLIDDKAGTEGYPGAVHLAVTYTLTNDDTLRIRYHATSSKATPVNFTNHSYFNLKDGGKSDVLGTMLHLYASHYTPVDSTLIPTGKIAPVAGTPYDFTKTKAIGQDIEEAKGFDHNFVIDGKGFRQAAGAFEPTTGRTMQVWTDQPGVQLYTANFLDGTLTGRDGAKYGQHHAFCLETQHFPDSPNQKNFPSTILKPGKPFESTTEYRFGVMK